MNKPYFVQVIARNYLKNLMPPVPMEENPRFLHDLDAPSFEAGFAALHALMENLYGDIGEKPESFGLLLKDDNGKYENNPDFRNSELSFLKMPNLLFALGAVGVLQPDRTLLVAGKHLLAAAKALKIPVTGLTILLEKLQGYGFEIKGLGKTVKPGDTIALAHTASLLTVPLKAMAEAVLETNDGKINKPKYLFYLMHQGLLENEKVKVPKLPVESVFRAVSPADRANAVALHESVAGIAKAAVKAGGSGGGICTNLWTATYTGTKSKKVLMSLHVDGDNFFVKLNLYHIGSYMPVVAQLPGKMQQSIGQNGLDCGRCNTRCVGGIAFEMEGKAYNKCRCSAFIFKDLTAEDVIYCRHLLAEELAF